MESPVRICIGAVLVVILLLEFSTPIESSAIPNDITSTTPKDDKRHNNTRIRTKPDISLNELNPKESVSEEHTEKNAKYKDRGRVKYGVNKYSTNTPRRSRSTTSTEAAQLVIVTPTAEVKKPTQIIDSMKTYKRTRMPVFSTPASSSSQSVEEDQEKDDEENKESFEKYTSNQFHDSYFKIPNFDDEFKYDHDSNDKNRLKDYGKSSYSFSTYFPESSDFKEDKDPFKSSFFDFDTELTTPKNDFFDKKYKKISSSIINRLQSIKAMSPPPNVTNVGLERLSNNTPSNKSSVYIKNTKEIRVSDNEGAGSTNKKLTDVQGTSVYYEMSVLSTETYTINHSDDDCDNDSASVEPTVSTSSEKELASIKSTQSTSTESESSISKSSEVLSTSASLFHTPTALPNFHNYPFSTQNSISSTERIRLLPSLRNRNYSKRLNLVGVKDSLNSVTPQPEISSTLRTPLQVLQNSRKFFTTPRAKPVWMSPRRNITRAPKPVSPSTIYAEHFSIKDKFSTTKPRVPSRTVLTTVSSSEIDPVLVSDVSGIKKIVHSQTVRDNAIPSLRKRGSMKYATSTASSAEIEADINEFEMPSTAWALASLRSPPSLPSPVVNATENELQNVGETTDKKETTSSTSTTTATPISNDIITKKITEVEQNKLWQPSYFTSPTIEQSTEAKVQRIPVESNISEKTSADIVSSESIKENTVDVKSKTKEVKPLWIPAAIENETTSAKTWTDKTIPPIDVTRSTGFESITKLPADVTTPQDETVASSELNQTVADKPKTTTDYEITTIRFSYVPTETTEEITDTTNFDTTTETVWNSVVPTRTRLTTLDDSPITTYRPKYMTTTEVPTEEPTTVVPDTTPILEVSSQIVSNASEKTSETTETTQQSSTEVTTTEESAETTPTPTTTIKTTTTSTTLEPTTETPEDTTTVVFEVVTEINTEKQTLIPVSTTETPTSTEEDNSYTSSENSDSNEIIHEDKTTTQPEQETTQAPTTIIATVEEDTSETTTQEATSQTRPSENSKTSKPPGTSDASGKIITTTSIEESTTTDEETTSYGSEMTTEASSRVLPEEAGSGAAIAIAVSTIGVIALILLIGLLLVVRRRGRRGVYAQRCTPVSLDAYSLDSVSVGHRKGNQRLRASKRSYGNPAYDDEVTSHPMQYPALANFALDVDSMTAEFHEIPTVTVRPEEVPPGCEDKNRYSNVLPLPETRVPLRRIGNDPTTEYINANYVTGPGNIKNYYILCQAPLSNTVTDFWRMIWEQNSRVVVMLTEYMENGVEKCYEYLPPSEISDNKRTFGDFKVVLKKREQRDKYAISSVQLINMATRTWREIYHLWYFWPAKGVPEDYDSVIDFLFEMRSYMKVAQTAKEYDEEGVEVIYGDQNRSSFNNLSKLKSEENGSGNGVNVYSPAKAEEQMRRNANNGTLSRMKAASEIEGIRPCVVVCASGAGRSGALAALDVCARALAAGAVDVPRAVRRLRTMRPHSLSNRHHYIFLYKVLSEYGNKIMGGGDNI